MKKVDPLVELMMICNEGAFKKGVLFGINYMIAGSNELFEEFGGKDITEKDIEDWGLKSVLDEANKKTRADYLKKYKKIIKVV